MAGNNPFQSADVIHIGDHALGYLSANRREECHAARRHVGDVAGKLAPIGQHETAEEIDLDPLKTPAFLAQRQDYGFFQRECHEGGLRPGKMHPQPIEGPLMAR